MEDAKCHSFGRYVRAEGNLTQVSIALVHQILLLGSMSELRSTGPKFIPLLATRIHYWGMSELRSSGPKFLLLLATRCHYQRGTSELRSTRCKLVPLLATRCSTGWYIWRSAWPKDWPNIKLTWQYHSWPPDATTRGYIWAQVNWTHVGTALGHQIPLPRGTCDLSAKRTSKNLNTLCISWFSSQRSFLQKTNKLKTS